MSKISIISASAGSGKTYRLSEILAGRIRDGSARPEAVVATTFTRKAAAELEVRVRNRLIVSDRLEDANRLAAARIGTVNSVCGQIVAEFCFELGLSPELDIIDEALVDTTLQKALANAIDGPTRSELQKLNSRMEGLEWENAVHRLIQLARLNRLDPSDLDSCAARSVESALALFGEPSDSGVEIDRGLREALGEFLARADLAVDTTKTTRKYYEDVRRIHRRLEHEYPVQWKDWVRLVKSSPGKKSREFAEPIARAAAQQDHHPGLRRDVQRAIELVFRIARDALRDYQMIKKEWGVIDFTDQEVFALRLLENPGVQRRLANQIDLVLVDEFQDTSPIQLAIFLRLAELAKESVWVGDQKQSIYGFRGTDPALMDAAVATILAGENPETLSKSWRSRPELVEVTSRVFSRSFPAHGIPAERVVLEAAKRDLPSELGPVIEYWRSDSKNVEGDANGVASCVRQLLADEAVAVRDPETGSARTVRPGDVAILCRTGDHTRGVAVALERLGISAVVPSPGLLTTPEGRIGVRALQVVVDPRDSLAIAEIGRFLVEPENPDAWFERVSSEAAAEGFSDLAEIERLRKARSEAPDAGALASLDIAFEAVGLAELCRRWGDAERRLRNVDRLRAHAVAYEEHCASIGAGCTASGLVAWLWSLAGDGQDQKAALADERAVTVSTWHGAKGLEWPITVLFDLERLDEVDATGVQVVSDADQIDLADPLADRWIRFWPNPYDPRNTGMPFHERLANDPATGKLEAREQSQRFRLLYVGWTRARDRLVFAGRNGQLVKGTLSLLKDHETGEMLVSEPAPKAQTAMLGGIEVDVTTREGQTEEPHSATAIAGEGYESRARREYPPARVAPSDTGTHVASVSTEERPEKAAATAGHELEKIGERIRLSGTPEMRDVGEAIHGFLAADRPEFAQDERLQMAQGLLERWGVAPSVEPKSLLAASDALRCWADGRWPGAIWRREWPVLHKLDNGSEVHGFVDLVITFDDSFVVIDHKSFPGDMNAAAEKAAGFARQVRTYVEALEAATDRKAGGAFIHLPVSGAVMEI